MQANERKSVNSPQEIREIVVEIPQTFRKRFVSLALAFICGITIAAAAFGNLVLLVAGCTVLLGYLLNFVLHWTVFTPKAGFHAKDAITEVFISDDPQNKKLVTLVSVGILANIAGLAQTEKGKEMLKPLLYTAMDAFHESYEMRMLNLRSQVKRGAGEFAPDKTGEFSLDEIWAEGGHTAIMQIGSDAGLPDKLSGMISQKIYRSLQGVGGNSPAHSPERRSGYVPLGGE